MANRNRSTASANLRSGGATTKFLNENGSYSTPSGGGAWITSKLPSAVTGLKLWVTGGTVGGGLVDGNSVTTWPDQSGNGFDFSQATAGSKPVYKTGIINSLPVVRFDATDDGMNETGITITHPFSMVLVADQTVSPATASYRTVQSTASNVWFISGSNSGGADMWQFYSGGSSTQTGAQLSGSPFTIITLTETTTLGFMWANGRGCAIKLNPANAPGQISLGACAGVVQPVAGDIAEFALYDNVISEADRIAIEQGFREKYALY